MSDAAARADYVRAHALEWRLGWGLWLVATTTLTWMYLWWAGRLPAHPIIRPLLALTFVGYASDLVAQSLLIGRVPDHPDLMPLASALTGGVTNVLYTIGGIGLSLRTPQIRGALAFATAAMWLGALGVSFFLLADAPLAIAASSALLYVIFVPWCVVLARRLA